MGDGFSEGDGDGGFSDLWGSGEEDEAVLYPELLMSVGAAVGLEAFGFDLVEGVGDGERGGGSQVADGFVVFVVGSFVYVEFLRFVIFVHAPTRRSFAVVVNQVWFRCGGNGTCRTQRTEGRVDVENRRVRI